MPEVRATDLYCVQGDVSPVQTVPVIIKVQSHSFPESGQRQSLVRAGGQVVAVDGVSHGVKNELVTLCGERNSDDRSLIWISLTGSSLEAAVDLKKKKIYKHVILTLTFV